MALVQPIVLVPYTLYNPTLTNYQHILVPGLITVVSANDHDHGRCVAAELRSHHQYKTGTRVLG